MKASVIFFILCAVAFSASYVHELAYSDDKCEGNIAFNRYYMNDTCIKDPRSGEDSPYFFFTCTKGTVIKNVCDQTDSTCAGNCTPTKYKKTCVKEDTGSGTYYLHHECVDDLPAPDANGSN